MVIASFAAEDKVVMVVNSDGQMAADRQPLCRLNVTVIAEDGGNRQTGSFGGGGRVEWGYFLEDERWRQYAARRRARRWLTWRRSTLRPVRWSSCWAPDGPACCCMRRWATGWRVTSIARRPRPSAAVIGQRVASELCTVVDDGTIPSRRGSLNIDDEGTPTRRNVLIENGILRGYLQDRLNARLMAVEPTGNGRRESFAHIPMPRMTNTFMLAGGLHP